MLFLHHALDSSSKLKGSVERNTAHTARGSAQYAEMAHTCKNSKACSACSSAFCLQQCVQHSALRAMTSCSQLGGSQNWCTNPPPASTSENEGACRRVARANFQTRHVEIRFNISADVCWGGQAAVGAADAFCGEDDGGRL